MTSRNERTARKAKGKNKRNERASWAMRRSHKSFWGMTPPNPKVVDLFAVESSDTTVDSEYEEKTEEEGENEEEPNTDDRRFVKRDSEPTNLSEYVPTDPEEFSGFGDETPAYPANRANGRGYHGSEEELEELETK